jgi:hypothetical protein
LTMHLYHCVSTAMTCMQKIVKFKHKMAKRLEIEFSTGCLQCGPYSTSVCWTLLYIRHRVPGAKVYMQAFIWDNKCTDCSIKICRGFTWPWLKKSNNISVLTFYWYIEHEYKFCPIVFNQQAINFFPIDVSITTGFKAVLKNSPLTLLFEKILRKKLIYLYADST